MAIVCYIDCTEMQRELRLFPESGIRMQFFVTNGVKCPMCNQKEIKAMIVDDHPLMAQATAALLKQMDGIEIAAIVSDGKQSLQGMEELAPDLVILEWRVKDVYQTDMVKRMKAASPDSLIVIFTGLKVEELYPEIVPFQIHGLISKEAGHDTIQHAIACILEGYTVFPEITYLTQISAKATADIVLNEGEATIMSLVLKGCTIEQIAEHMHFSKRSIDNYLSRIYKKMGVTGRAQAIKFFMQTPYYQK